MKLCLTAILLVGLMTGITSTGFPTGKSVPIVRGNSQFAWELYGKLREEWKSVLFPSKISVALGMTSGGARENTLKEMLSTLHLPADGTADAAFSRLVQSLIADPQSKGYELRMANAIWGQTGMEWSPDFIKNSKQHYGAGLNDVDFVQATESARKTINQWVEKETNNRIKDLIGSGVLTPLTRMVLTNAVYFKGDWMKQFDPKRTQEGNFNLGKDKVVKVPLMYQKGDYRMYEDESLQLLELPYKGKRLSMLIFLPRSVDGLVELEKQLNDTQVEKWIAGIQKKTDVAVTIPKFKFESSFSVNDALQALGMKDAFSDTKANFSGLTKSPDNGLYITKVLHKAFIEVNEEGSEAAAATAVVVGVRSLPRTPVFRADRPFVFAIRDNEEGSLLFIGRVANPKE